MSFEGYYEFLCEDGHFFSADVYQGDENGEKCPVCNKPVKWWNIVDQTNDSGTPTRLKQKTAQKSFSIAEVVKEIKHNIRCMDPDIKEACKLLDDIVKHASGHVLKERTYYIPTGDVGHIR